MVKGALFELLFASWPTLVIFLVIIILLRLFYYKNSSKKLILHEEILLLVFVTYILLLFELVTNRDVYSGTNLVPFREILRYNIGSSNFYKQVLGNIVLFVPFGFFASYYTKINKIRSITLITFLVSLTIEIVQIYIGRSFDIDDIILNIVGGVLGFLIYVGLDAIGKKLPSFMTSDLFLSFLSILVLGLFVLYLLGIVNLGWL